MIFTQYYLECLSHASYLIGDDSTGRAVVVDPRRDVDEYIADAERAGLRIERVIETHVHADFVSGHLELAARTGSVISYGEDTKVEFDIEPLSDGQQLSLGEVELEILATPGHTPESISIVVRERAGAQPFGVLTGDTLFIGDVGRPDLLAAVGITPEEMAAQLYRSLHERLLTLPDATKVYPAHGAGSACGKHLAAETQSTIGQQRAANYALAPMSEAEFVAMITEGQPLAPGYFSYDAQRNREARPLLEEHESPVMLSIDEVLAKTNNGAIVLDTREPHEFAHGHLRGSINVWLASRFAEYAGDVLDPHDDIVLVCDQGAEVEARVRLSRIGFDRVVGVLDEAEAVLAERPDLVEGLSRVSVTQLDDRRDDTTGLVIVDVRNPAEQEHGMIPGAVANPLPRLREALERLDRRAPTVVYCASGARSVIAASVLAAHGFEDVSDLLGGYDAYARAQEAA
jgi:hydroxyacylglutathione hydrolase